MPRARLAEFPSFQASAATRCWLALLASSILVVTPFFASPILAGKQFCFHVAAGVALLLTADRLRLGRTSLCVALFSAWVVLTSVIHPGPPSRALDHLAAVALALGVSASTVPRRTLLVLLAGVGAVVAAIGLAQQWVPLPSAIEVSRPGSLLGSRLAAGEFTAALVPAVAALSLRRQRWLRLTLLVLLSAFLVTTRSRAGWIGGGVGLAFVLVHLPRGRAMLSLLAVAVGVALAVTATPGPRVQWHATSPYLSSLTSVSPAITGRMPTWRNALHLIAAHPAVGIGPGRFRDEYPAFSAAHAPDPSFSSGLQVEEPHSEYLRIGAELGLVGAALLLLLLLPFRRRRPASWRTTGPLGGLLAIAVCMSVSISLTSTPTLLIAAVFYGLAWRGRPSGGQLPRYVGVSAGAALLVATAAFDGSALIASRLESLGQTAAREGHPREAVEHFAAAARWSPYSEASLQEATLAASVRDHARCLAAAARVLALTPQRLEALRLQGDCAAGLGLDSIARASYRAGLAILPTNYPALLGLARREEDCPTRRALALAAQTAANADLQMLSPRHAAPERRRALESLAYSQRLLESCR